MKIYFAIILSLVCFVSFSQTKAKPAIESLNDPRIDSLVKQRLVELAMKNPAFSEADAQVNSAKYELKRAKTSWLNTVTIGGNVNEFVVNNTTINGVAASTLYPKYNIGLNVPLGLFGRQEKNLANEKIKLYQAQKDARTRELKKEVLIRYENYKEKRDLFELQKIVTDGQESNYKQKQKDFANNEIKDISEVNKEYDLWINQRSTQRTKDKELKVAELELEEIIGMKFSDAIAGIELNK